MKNIVLAFVAGLVFGVGLLFAGMTQPGKVIAFLDLFGGWDPSLAFVMGGAIGVHFLAYRLIPRLQKPLFAPVWALPTRRDVDGRLLLGAVLFGAGWGLGGYCPGPALTAAVSGAANTLVFVGAMLAGMWIFAQWDSLQAAKKAG